MGASARLSTPLFDRQDKASSASRSSTACRERRPITPTIREKGRLLGVIGMPQRPGYLSSRLGALKSTVPSDRPFLKARPGEGGFFRRASSVDKMPRLFAWRRLSAFLVRIRQKNDELARGETRHRVLFADAKSPMLTDGRCSTRACATSPNAAPPCWQRRATASTSGDVPGQGGRAQALDGDDARRRRPKAERHPARWALSSS